MFELVKLCLWLPFMFPVASFKFGTLQEGLEYAFGGYDIMQTQRCGGENN